MPRKHGKMELRHLRYFVAVAETGSLTEAAETRLHTSQPSLSRQLRDLEAEVGTPLFVRGSRGVVLTSAGKAFLDHARLALLRRARRFQLQGVPPGPPRPALPWVFLRDMRWSGCATSRAC